MLALFHWDSAKLDAIIQQMQLLGIAEVMIDSNSPDKTKCNKLWNLLGVVSNSPLFPEHLIPGFQDQAIWYHERCGDLRTLTTWGLYPDVFE